MVELSKVADFSEILEGIRQKAESQPMINVYRFDIFKGKRDPNGKVTKIKSVGAAYLRDGMKTYTVMLKTFLQDKFYLLTNSKPETKCDFVILTREPAQNSGRKYFWNNVGGGIILAGINHGLMELSWDVLASDLYMTLHPANVTELPEAARADAA